MTFEDMVHRGYRAENIAEIIWAEWRDRLYREDIEEHRFFAVYDINGWEIVRGSKQQHVVTVGRWNDAEQHAQNIAAAITRCILRDTSLRRHEPIVFDISYATFNHMHRAPPNVNVDDWRIVSADSPFELKHPPAPWVIRYNDGRIAVDWRMPK